MWAWTSPSPAPPRCGWACGWRAAAGAAQVRLTTCAPALHPPRQNEIGEADADLLIKHGCGYVVEGANMPSTNEAIHKYHKAGIVYCPGKAANAGGGAVSGALRGGLGRQRRACTAGSGQWLPPPQQAVRCHPALLGLPHHAALLPPTPPPTHLPTPQAWR